MITASSNKGELLQDRAYRLLRIAICEGDLMPGTELSENELAEVFALTKAPLRSALSRLSQEGWLSATARRGYLVRPITIRDTRDIFALRKILEGSAARMAAGNINTERLQALDEVCKTPYSVDDEEARRAFFSANRAFHVEIATASKNMRLASCIAKLHDECERILRFGMKHLDWSDDWSHGHEEIVEALAQGNGLEAERIVLRQLETSEKIVLDVLLRGFTDTPITAQDNFLI